MKKMAIGEPDGEEAVQAMEMQMDVNFFAHTVTVDRSIAVDK